MAAHTGPNQFEVLDVTIHGLGTIAYFLRKAEEAVTRLKSFFLRVNHNYARFNYLGEWHSHPSFRLEPSEKDDRSIREIVEDGDVGANFVVLLIVKLADNGDLLTRAYTYLPNSVKRFPGPEALAGLLADAGCGEVRWIITAGGIIALHHGTVA